MENLTRAFIAIELNEEIHRNLTAFAQTHSINLASGFRLVRPEIIHLTIKFLGETSTSQLNQVREELTAITSHVPPFEISIEGFGAFPNWRMPRVVWAGVQYPTTLKTLNDEIETAAVSLGFPPEHRIFSPHLTLARVNDVNLQPDLACALAAAANTCPVFGKVTVKQVLLFKSVLQRGGPEYTALSTHPLIGCG